MRGPTSRQRLWARVFGLILAAALFPGSTEASRGALGAVIMPIPAPAGAMSLVANSTSHALAAVAVPRHLSSRRMRISYRRIVRPHIITVGAGPAAARRFPQTRPGDRSLVFTERFPRVDAPHGSILIVRGDDVGFVLFP